MGGVKIEAKAGRMGCEIGMGIGRDVKNVAGIIGLGGFSRECKVIFRVGKDLVRVERI